VSFNARFGIDVRGDRAQIQQSTANGNEGIGILVGNNCLVTMNTANSNSNGGILVGHKCTVSYNTANDNTANDNGLKGSLLVSPSALGVSSRTTPP